MQDEDKSKVDSERRNFLIAATTFIGGIGTAIASVPFLASWLPSAKTQAMGAPIKVDTSTIKPGEKLTVAWRGQPIFIVNRTPGELESVAKSTDLLRDPNSTESIQPKDATNEFRSIKENIFVAVGICTHLGCVPLYKPEPGSVDPSWLGGFFCPCHGSKYDFAGRVYKGVPAPTNLSIPPYRYLDDKIILIGEDVSK